MAIHSTGFDVGKPSVAAKYNGKLRRPSEKKDSERIHHILHNVYYQTGRFLFTMNSLRGIWRVRIAICVKASPSSPLPDHAIRNPETQGG